MTFLLVFVPGLLAFWILGLLMPSGAFAFFGGFLWGGVAAYVARLSGWFDVYAAAALSALTYHSPVFISMVVRLEDNGDDIGLFLAKSLVFVFLTYAVVIAISLWLRTIRYEASWDQ